MGRQGGNGRREKEAEVQSQVGVQKEVLQEV